MRNRMRSKRQSDAAARVALLAALLLLCSPLRAENVKQDGQQLGTTEHPAQQQPGVDPKHHQQRSPNRPAITLPDCADTNIGASQLELAASAEVVITGITLAAGPGAGSCDKETGALSVALDNSTDPSTNFIVLGVQCVHKGLLSCRANPEDTKDCLVLVAAPTMKDAPPCSLMQGERYQLYLQKQTNGCAGYYLTMYERIYHSVRRPLGGTGCTFYPYFPQPDELKVSLAATCTQPARCRQDMCSPLVSKSPCANDTAVNCTLKTCPGKWMFHNAILPEDTCYEVYTYSTSGLPTNCYGRRYINNRIRQLASKDPGFMGNMTAGNMTADAAADAGTARHPEDLVAAQARQQSADNRQSGPATQTQAAGNGMDGQQGATGGGMMSQVTDPMESELAGTHTQGPAQGPMANTDGTPNNMSSSGQAPMPSDMAAMGAAYPSVGPATGRPAEGNPAQLAGLLQQVSGGGEQLPANAPLQEALQVLQKRASHHEPQPDGSNPQQGLEQQQQQQQQQQGPSEPVS